MLFKVITEQHVRDIFQPSVGFQYLPLINTANDFRKKLLYILLKEGEENPSNIANVFTDYMKLQQISDVKLESIMDSFKKIHDHKLELHYVTTNLNEILTKTFRS